MTAVRSHEVKHNGSMRDSTSWAHRAPRVALGWALILYRALISPMIGPACRFEPSCSRYAGEAIEQYGAMRGIWLSPKRLSRCHPLGGSGYDPVPGAIE